MCRALQAKTWVVPVHLRFALDHLLCLRLLRCTHALTLKYRLSLSQRVVPTSESPPSNDTDRSAAGPHILVHRTRPTQK
jgi:hypothetical protein